jgi:hypothetical protein
MPGDAAGRARSVRSMGNDMAKHTMILPVPMTVSRKAHAARLRFLHELWADVQIDTPAESRARDSAARRRPHRSNATRNVA